MTQAHRKPKDPEQVRAALLGSARSMVVEAGIAGLSVNAVAAAAGVTKGAFFHHFGSKAALVDAVFAGLFGELDREIDEAIAADDEQYGSFTRAYVHSVFRADERHQTPPFAGLWISAIADPDIRADWAAWLRQRLERHRETDGDDALQIIRFAADGVWLADILGVTTADRAALHDRLIQQTRKGA
ncbi:TetR family transcriptional regulator [Mesorhizobium sp. BR1-1-16]|uniref:TetR/AcrR family transcriptional regulator n=1 Tax=Mesorhizobium sp. BR1-1-16 TaxID=2876653 RepID=UPI001CCC76ED|nr:TetR family transcriptional regulator [Mesorhizobium sp. BR1-1-16]MBZ9935815.1 TetR family transcriptional regulator [Mesorhizobium sp. BR1-1-16]